jgi:hypothetical protein
LPTINAGLTVARRQILNPLVIPPGRIADAAFFMLPWLRSQHKSLPESLMCIDCATADFFALLWCISTYSCLWIATIPIINSLFFKMI